MSLGNSSNGKESSYAFCDVSDSVDRAVDRDLKRRSLDEWRSSIRLIHDELREAFDRALDHAGPLGSSARKDFLSYRARRRRMDQFWNPRKAGSLSTKSTAEVTICSGETDDS